jgi:hypothetical protein
MAVYPVTPGAPDYSSTSTNAYIPAIYSALLIKKFYPQTVWGKLSNTDYEGDIKDHGDTVYIRTRPTIETFRYKKGMVLPVQNPESPYVTLKVDQGEGFSFAIDKVDEFQSDIKLMNEWADDATKQMAQVIDRNVLISIAAAGAVVGGQAATTVSGYSAANCNAGLQTNYTAALGALCNGTSTAKGTTVSLGTSAASTSANTGDEITALLNKYGRYLMENNAPPEGWFCIVPAWASQHLKDMSNNSFGLAYATGQNSANALANSVPKFAGFEIITSNNLPASTESTTDPSAIIFGCAYATTFATQITESRIIDNPFAFGKMMQGLQVYGFNVIKPALLGVDFWKNA